MKQAISHNELIELGNNLTRLCAQTGVTFNQLMERTDLEKKYNHIYYCFQNKLIFLKIYTKAFIPLTSQVVVLLL